MAGCNEMVGMPVSVPDRDQTDDVGVTTEEEPVASVHGDLAEARLLFDSFTKGSDALGWTKHYVATETAAAVVSALGEDDIMGREGDLFFRILSVLINVERQHGKHGEARPQLLENLTLEVEGEEEEEEEEDLRDVDASLGVMYPALYRGDVVEALEMMEIHVMNSGAVVWEEEEEEDVYWRQQQAEQDDHNTNDNHHQSQPEIDERGTQMVIIEGDKPVAGLEAKEGVVVTSQGGTDANLLPVWTHALIRTEESVNNDVVLFQKLGERAQAVEALAKAHVVPVQETLDGQGDTADHVTTQGNRRERHSADVPDDIVPDSQGDQDLSKSNEEDFEVRSTQPSQQEVSKAYECIQNLCLEMGADSKSRDEQSRGQMMQNGTRSKRIARNRREYLSTVMAQNGVSRPDIGWRGSKVRFTPSSDTMNKMKNAHSPKDKGVFSPLPDGWNNTNNETEYPLLSGLHATAECIDPGTDGAGDLEPKRDNVQTEERRSKRVRKQTTKVADIAPSNTKKQRTKRNNGDSQEQDVEVRTKPHLLIATAPQESDVLHSAISGGKYPGKTRSKKGKENPSSSTATKCTENVPLIQYVSRKKRDSLDAENKPAAAVQSMPEKFNVPPEKVGCSKCRYSGCRRCRGYTLRELKEWQAQHGSNVPMEKAKKKASHNSNSTTMPLILNGFHFMISVQNKQLKLATAEKIVQMGGVEETTIPAFQAVDPSQSTRKTRKQKNEKKDTVVKRILVANNASSRTIKSLFARVAGIPIVSPDWINACYEKKHLEGLTARSPHVLLAKSNGIDKNSLRGLQIAVATGEENLVHVTNLLAMLGGKTIRYLDMEKKISCDLLLYEDAAKSQELKADMHKAQRIARGLRIPSRPMSWLTNSILSGNIDIPLSTAAMNRDAFVIPATEESISEDARITNSIKKNKRAAVATPSTAQRAVNVTPRTVTKPPVISGKTQSITKTDNELLEHRTNNFTEAENRCQTMSSLSSFQDILCTWSLSGPLEPPSGFRKSSIRKYYESMSSGTDVIHIGDFVQLLPDPCAKYPKVGQVVALWKQLGMPQGQRTFGQFRRFYRFDETSLRQMQISKDDDKNSVFRTEHIEDNVPLASVMSKCHVHLLQAPLDEPAKQQSQPDNSTFYCAAAYDHETGALLPLSADL